MKSEIRNLKFEIRIKAPNSKYQIPVQASGEKLQGANTKFQFRVLEKSSKEQIPNSKLGTRTKAPKCK
jgi:hypothetical protein